MKISFHGAARTVTGSKHLIHTQNGKQILLDCGLFQGMGDKADVLNAQWGFDPEKVDVVVISHAHIDHIGLLPKLVKDGFRGPIWCTPATQSLMGILLHDSAEIQESDARYANKRREDEKEYTPPVLPLYTTEDVVETLPLIQTLDYKEEGEILPGVTLHFTDTGHILGSAAVNLSIQENGKTVHLTFSGDIGQYRDPLLCAPQPFPQADIVIMESTYGNNEHPEAQHTQEALLKHINDTCVEKGGKLIIPAFSLGRTQEILFQLNDLYNKGLLPKMPVFVDSPMALEATRVLKAYPEYFNREVQRQLRTDDDVFDFPGLHFTQSVADSKHINLVKEACIIIASSGMAEAGRIRHHIRNGIGNKANKILLVGYCDPHSLGGKLKAGAKEVRIFGDEYEVRCDVAELDSMSAHGDASDLIHWLSCQEGKPEIYLVHGEPEVQEAFRERLESLDCGKVYVPAMHETVSHGS